MKSIPYGKQFLDKEDEKFVKSSLSKNFITTGPSVIKFEKDLRRYLKSKFAYVCNSGTSAIHLALLSLKVKKNDIILMPAINFVASYNMSRLLGAKIFLVDVDSKTGQMTPETVVDCIKKNKIKKIKILFLMYHGGYPENIIKFYKLKKKYRFSIIEDACHALGSGYLKNKKVVKIGSCLNSDICTFSFHPLKSITTGEGGAITTNNKKISDQIKIYRNHGIKRDKKFYWKYNVLDFGFNYRISDINCSLGISQLKKLDIFLLKRKDCYDYYLKEFKNYNKNIFINQYSKDLIPSYHLVIININFKNLRKDKDHFIKYLNKNSIFPQSHYIPLYKFEVFHKRNFKLEGAEKYFGNSLSLPIFVGLTKKQQKFIVTKIKNYFNS